MTSINQIILKPIGYVRNNLGKRSFNEWKNTESEIVIKEVYEEALYRLEEYSHIDVLFYLHEMNRDFKTRIHPTGNPNYPLMGAFATRTPNRPNKIALTTSRLLSVNGNILRVRNLDAYNRSPIIDIKPHTAKSIENPEVPKWIKNMKK